MRILVVSDRFPFPPRDGLTLPVSHLVRGLARRHEVHLGVLGSMDASSVDQLPAEVSRLTVVPFRRPGGVSRTMDEFLFRRPSYVVRGFDDAALDELLDEAPFDVAWLSPVGCWGLVEACRRRGRILAHRLAVGLNDPSTAIYFESAMNLLWGRAPWTLPDVALWARLPWLWAHERRILKKFDLIHVQTPLEGQRTRRLLGRRQEPRILVAQNGRNTVLDGLTYEGGQSPVVLFMTPLDGSRGWESDWFLKNVWPGVRRGEPGATLRIVGFPPPAGRTRSLPAGVIATGFADDLPQAYAGASVAVLPITRGTGVINRALDALIAGVPLVATSRVLATIDGLVPGVHAVAADSSEAFAEALVRLLGSAAERARFSEAGRQLARAHPSWEETVAVLCREVEALA